MENLGYLFAAYTIIFVVIFLYVLFIWRRQTHLEAELRAMESRLKDVRDELSARTSQSAPQSRSAQ
jgi:CcmD family protein